MFLSQKHHQKHFQLMVSGDNGHLVVSALRPVEEDINFIQGAVTLQLQPMVGNTVLVLNY